jgi:hypothetical protein
MLYFPYIGILLLYCIKINFKQAEKTLLPRKIFTFYDIASKGKLNSISPIFILQADSKKMINFINLDSTLQAHTVINW